ncbi:EXT2 [Mytilus coruscus]|uniref:EXT2 n=1 Tax=Mytilus coruscus TaxID=42192 RepID=A0A6J8EAE9_MYTCO|nr:EXT2 [Mytilus coruscus]
MLRMFRKIKKRNILLLCVCVTVVLFLLFKTEHVEIRQEPNKDETSKASISDNLFNLLNELDITIHKKAPEKKIYGNIYSDKERMQIESYFSAIKNFTKMYEVKTICEIGFAGGHSATLFLRLTDSASYIGFDMWDQPVYENTAIEWVRQQFKNRRITLIKGDSTKTVPQFQGKCDIIHIDGAHHAHFPQMDMKNMARVASVNNLLLIDDCSKSWPAVLKGVEYLKTNDLLDNLNMHVPEGWIYRGAKKGWCVGSYKVKNQAKHMPNSFTFLDQTFCTPSWHGHNCEVYSSKPCSKLSDECFYSNVTGTLSVSCERWHGAQSVEQITWDKRVTSTDRNEEHAKSFNSYQFLPQHLGNVIEIGAGPFTQAQTILQGKTAASITLIEPMAFHYMTNVKRCFYKNGSFGSLPTTILSIPAEELSNTRKFDTLIMINVIEHVYDAISIFNATINLIKENGIFIWHERIWNNYLGVANSEHDREFQLHPIRIKHVIAKQVLSMFDEKYISWDTEELRRLQNHGVYFIGHRRNIIAKTLIPQHPPCFEQIGGRQTIIFFVSNENATFIQDQLKLVNNAANTKLIVIIQTNEFNDTAISNVLQFQKIRILISYQHLHNWKKEVTNYVEPCLFIFPHLTLAMLEGSDTYCVGNSGVTVILMGYSPRRLNNYDLILPAYVHMPITNQIILIWNNRNISFTPKIDSSKITFIKAKVNSMNNRFNVSQYVHTDAVLIIDDDVLISDSLLSLMLLRWSENIDRLVGISTDKRFVNSKNEYLVQGKEPSLVIGKTMLFHHKYLQKYMQDKALVEWNDKRFCEDISMNALIFKETKLKPLFVPMTAHSSRRNLPDIDGASIIDKNWLIHRTECVQWAAEYFKIQLY